MKVPKPRLLDSGRWFVRLRLGGKEYAKTFATEKEARDWAALIKAQHNAGVLAQKKPAEDKTIRQLIDAYLDANALSQRSVDMYRRVQRNLFVLIMNRPYRSINNWQKAINLELEDKSPNAVSTYWTCTAAAIRFAGLPVPNVVIKTTPPKKKNYLNEQQIRDFCARIKGHPYEIWCLMMLSSMRVSEALSVVPSDVTDQGIHVRGTKTPASDRFVPWMIPRLRELCEQKVWPAAPSVVTMNEYIKKISAEMEIPRLSCHSLRVSFVSLCYYKGVPEHVVMKVGGWTSPDVVHKHYLRIYDDDVNRWAQAVSDVFD